MQSCQDKPGCKPFRSIEAADAETTAAYDGMLFVDCRRVAENPIALAAHRNPRNAQHPNRAQIVPLTSSTIAVITRSRIKRQPPERLAAILGFANAWRRSATYILVGVEEVRGGNSNVVGIDPSDQLDDRALQQFVNNVVNLLVMQRDSKQITMYGRSCKRVNRWIGPW